MPICLTKCLHGEDMGKHHLPGCGEQLRKIHHLTSFRLQGGEVAPLLLFCRESPVAPSVRDELGRLSMWNSDEPRACRSVCSRKCCNIFTAALGDPFSSDLVESTFPPSHDSHAKNTFPSQMEYLMRPRLASPHWSVLAAQPGCFFSLCFFKVLPILQDPIHTLMLH